MDFALEQSWKELFALAAEAKAAMRREEKTRLFYEDLDRERDKKQKIKEKEENEAKELEGMATAAQLAAFTQRLDEYDTQTVHALMENGEALDKLRLGLRQMEENAYVLPDGRRVFKTMDGRRVFDEKGAEVSQSTIDPQMIDDRSTRWETYKGSKDAEGKLEAERHGLLQFQAKLDDARSRASKGDITKKELDDLDADLKASAPPSVRRKLGLATADTDRDMKLQSEDPSPARQAALIDDPYRRVQLQPAP